MRISLADVKKTFSRRGGVVALVPHLLRRGELARELAALIALYEAHLGQTRAAFPEERPGEVVGDYRLGRGLATCLGEWYAWETPAWPSPATAAQGAALAERGITAPAHLRLALYDAVNASGAGYLPNAERAAVLTAFAHSLGLEPATLDALLRLDGEPATVLRRTAATAPTSLELAARYNQRAVEAILASAATVEWVLATAGTSAPGSGGTPGALGTIVKRVCFLARRMGVLYDVAFDDLAPDAPAAEEDEGDEHATAGEQRMARVAEHRAPYAASAPVDAAGRDLRITLYGPQEVTGAPNQYGERLARLTRALLGYRRAPEPADADSATHAALHGVGLHGTAHLYLHGRPVTCALDDRLLRLLRLDARDADEPDAAASGTGESYDSALEERFAEEFAALGERLPILWYTARVSAQALLGVLDHSYNDLEQRLAMLDAPRLASAVARRGCISPAESLALLRCYTRAELAEALRRLEAQMAQGGESAPVWVEGLGLCAPAWRDALLARAHAAVSTAPAGRLASTELRQHLAGGMPELAGLTAETTETLATLAGLAVVRTSIFEAEIRLSAPNDAPSPQAAPPAPPTRRPQLRGGSRRKHLETTAATQLPFMTDDQ